jgi:hypothetical protein
MPSKGQFVTLFFSVFLITAVIAIFTLEYNNLISSQDINMAEINTFSSNALAYDLSQQFYFLAALNPSASANSFAVSALEALNSAYFSNYILNLTSGISLSGPSGTSAYATALPLNIINTQPEQTPAPFQQIITINSSKYLKYESNSLSNVQFSYQNGTIIPSWVESGNIAAFNGVNSHMNVANTPALNPTAVTEIAWIRPKTQACCTRVVSKASTGGTGNDYDIYVNGGSLGTRLKNATISEPIQTTSQVVAYNTWNMVAVTYNGNGTIKLYVNGTNVLSSTNLISGPLASSTAPLQFGCCLNGGSNDFFNGSVADVQIYNAALSQNQIQQVYSEGLGGAPISMNALIGWWPLAGNSNDASGNGNSGVENNVSFDTVGSASTATSYWLKLNSGILAHEDALIYMNFYSKSANIFNTINTGEAPQLSATYGQYDDGANVFNFYDNFAGTSLNLNKWTSYGNGTLTVNNGLELLANQGDTNKGISFASAVSTNNIMVEALMNVFGSSGTDIRDRVNHGIAGLTQTSGNGCCDDYGYFSVSTGPQPQYFIGSGASGTAVPFSPSATSYNLLDSQILTSGGDWTWQSLSWPSYSVIFQQTGTFTSGSTFSTGFSATTDLGGSGTTSEENLRWVRIRAYPPNGVMPLVSFGQIS